MIVLSDVEIHELQICLWCIYSVEFEEIQKRQREEEVRWKKLQAAQHEVLEDWCEMMEAPWRDLLCDIKRSLV